MKSLRRNYSEKLKNPKNMTRKRFTPLYLYIKDFIWHIYYNLVYPSNNKVFIKSDIKNPIRKILMIPDPQIFVDTGSVKTLCLNYKKYLERKNYAVEILVDTNLTKVAKIANSKEYDFVHFHNPLQLRVIKGKMKRDFCITNHRMKEILRNDNNLAPSIIALNGNEKDFYIKNGFKGVIGVVPNGVEREKFSFTPKGNGKAICMVRPLDGKGEDHLFNNLNDKVKIDFVGMDEIGRLKKLGLCNVLGKWSREEVHQRLTEYSCLVLNSKMESSSLTVMEALSAGLSLVVSKEAFANLDKKDFIEVVPVGMGDESLAKMINLQIENNDKYREEIREYSERFDFGNTLGRYIDFIEKSIK